MHRPAGIVTFVFTDIEGSTRLLAAHPDVYSLIVRRHREIITEEVDAHGGTVVGHEGDSCFLAFAEVPHAVEATHAAQRRLLSESWPSGAAVRVRMGVHTGPAELNGPDYYGLTVHTTARVADAAHGSQIVLSDPVARETDRPTKDLGIHRLKDIHQPLRLHQLLGTDLPSEFPRLRTMPSAATVRAPSTSFVGRIVDTERLAELLVGSRLVTLVGPGGIGKTRLALHIAEVVADLVPDGVWFADLTATDDPDAVAELIAEAVGVSTRSGGDPLSVAGDVLATARGLLIVDNFEHVVAAAPVVARLLASTEHLRILVTSRERLRLVDEQAYEVGPLTLHPEGGAVALFVDRARAVRPGYEPTPDEVATIVGICTRLDGLPLAIELAAARMRLLSPDEIARRLSTQAIGLGGGPRDLHARQQTIRSTIEWSYQLLGPAEQELLPALSVFVGPIAVSAIDAVLGTGDGATADVLSELIDKSLLQQRVDATGTTRVRMLQLVREYAEELFADRPEREALEREHARHFAAFAAATSREMLTDRPDASMRRIEADYGDIVRAFEWSLAHAPLLAVDIASSMAFYFHSTGLTHTAGRWEQATRSIPVDEVRAAHRDIAAGYVAFGFRRLADARVHWERAIPVLARIGDRLAEAWATMSLGATSIGDEANYRPALELVERGIRLAEEAGSPVLVGLGFNISGELSRVHGDDAAADAAYQAGTQIARTIDDHYREAICLGNRVYTALHRQDLETALTHGRAAAKIHRRHGHHNQLPWVAIALAGVLAVTGDIETAVTLQAAADESARRMYLEEMPGDVREMAAVRRNLRQLAGDRFDEWYRHGRTMSLDEALAVFDLDG